MATNKLVTTNIATTKPTRHNNKSKMYFQTFLATNNKYITVNTYTTP